jgi:hypothetical protein
MADIVLDALLELERAGWDSLCDASGSEFYGAVMLPGALMVLANGMVMDRDTVVSSLSESPPWRKYDIADVRLIDVDDDNAVLDLHRHGIPRRRRTRLRRGDVQCIPPHRRRMEAGAVHPDSDRRLRLEGGSWPSHNRSTSSAKVVGVD